MKKIQEQLTLLQVGLAFCMGVTAIACLVAVFQKNWVSSLLSGSVLLVSGVAYCHIQASLKALTKQIQERREND